MLILLLGFSIFTEFLPASFLMCIDIFYQLHKEMLPLFGPKFPVSICLNSQELGLFVTLIYEYFAHLKVLL